MSDPPEVGDTEVDPARGSTRPQQALPDGQLAPGQRLGKVMIERELGRGGMGVVYLGRHTTLDVPVAIKVVSPKLVGAAPEYRERLLREARLAARLSHPNAVGVKDADTDEATGLFFIVQEYVGGGSVEDRIRKRGPMPEKDALAVVNSIARALVAAAQHDIVHRDIKPANLLVGEDGRTKLADLGLARQVGTKGVTTTNSMLGTPAYMSPEQIDDAKAVDARTDVYSLGATLFHMITGTRPFDGHNVFAMLKKIADGPPPDPRGVVPTISADTAALCMKMMATDAAGRHQSAQELIDAIRGLRRAPTRDVPTPPLGPSERRELVWVSAGLLLAFAVIFALMISILGGGNGDGSGSTVVRVPDPGPGSPSGSGSGSPVLLPGSGSGSPVASGSGSGSGSASAPPVPEEHARLARGLAFLSDCDDLDELADQSRGRHPVRTAGVTQIAGRVGNALRFRGRSTVYVEGLIQQRSIALWVRPRAIGDGVFYDGGTIDNGRGLILGTFEPRTTRIGHWQGIEGGGGYYVGFWQHEAMVQIAYAGRWRHLVVVLDGPREPAGLTIYIDGSPARWSGISGSNSRLQPGRLAGVLRPRFARPLRLGSSRYIEIDNRLDPVRGAQLPPFSGLLDEVAVWSRPLSAAEVAQLWRLAGEGGYVAALAAAVRRGG